MIFIGLIDDIFIGNVYVSEEELKEMVEVFNVDYLILKVDMEEGIIENEWICLFDNFYSYWGDCLEYIFCLMMICVYYKEKDFLFYNMWDMYYGDVLIDNDGYG